MDNKIVILIALIFAAVAYLAGWLNADPNDVFGVAHILATVKEPNLPPPEPVEIPLIEQWLGQPKMKSTVYPKEVALKESGVEWKFIDGQWIPSHTGDSFMRMYHRPKANRAIIHCGKTRYIITGEFTITEMKPDVLSCDLTGDNKVNLLDFAEVSRKWMKGTD